MLTTLTSLTFEAHALVFIGMAYVLESDAAQALPYHLCSTCLGVCHCQFFLVFIQYVNVREV